MDEKTKAQDPNGLASSGPWAKCNQNHIPVCHPSILLPLFWAPQEQELLRPVLASLGKEGGMLGDH